MKRASILVIIIASQFFASCAYIQAGMEFFEGEQGDGLENAIPLLAIPVPTPNSVKPPDPGNPDGNGGTPGGGSEEPVHNLFALQPGQWASMSSMMGAIDPVGTSLPNDFDGDGILNSDETTTNIWVADYPLIETSISTPVTLMIEILNTQTKEIREIESIIDSNSTENHYCPKNRNPSTNRI